jgi:hypothetical protein
VIFHHHDSGTDGPSDTISTQNPAHVRGSRTGYHINNVEEWEIHLELDEPVSLDAGTYWVEIYADTTGDFDTFLWSNADFVWPVAQTASAAEAPGQLWLVDGTFNHAIALEADLVGPDCNGNGVLDACDVTAGIATDDDGDGVLDDCEPPQPRTGAGRVGG